MHAHTHTQTHLVQGKCRLTTTEQQYAARQMKDEMALSWIDMVLLIDETLRKGWFFITIPIPPFIFSYKKPIFLRVVCLRGYNYSCLVLFGFERLYDDETATGRPIKLLGSQR